MQQKYIFGSMKDKIDVTGATKFLEKYIKSNITKLINN
jgi:hypothetical protein